MREFGQEVVRNYEDLSFSDQVVIHLVLGLCAGILFGSLEHIYEKFIFRNIGFGKAVLLGSVGYVLVIILIIILAMVFFTTLSAETYSLRKYISLVFSKQTILLIFYLFIIGSLTNFLKEVDKKFGRGNLWKMFIGEFYSPKEEEKVFLFIDLKSSTKMAENLGHFKYSRMLQDCFQKLSVVDKYGAEVYQYVGDEAVLSWDLKIGLKDNNCINAFYAFKDEFDKHRTYFLSNYGLVPEFKAGMHLGKIVTAEIGELKREIAHHGDTINTAARIQENCNILNREFLISELAKYSLEESKRFKFNDEGEIYLKGKTDEVRVYSVHRIEI